MMLRTALRKSRISGTITRDYDGFDRLIAESTPQGTVAYAYDAAGRRASLTVPGQSDANYTFDNASRLTQINQGSSTVAFTYDNAGRRTSMTLPNGITATYNYDDGSQLTGLTHATSSLTLGNLSYAYDMAGRRISVGGSYARTNLPLPVSVTAYNTNNQLTTWGTANLFYDANGNMTSDGTHAYTWDARNRLNQIDSGSTASFIYDPLGRRASKALSGASTSFLYDGPKAVQEVIGANTANSLMGGVDEVFQRTDLAGARSFLTDALGSTLGLADSTDTVQTSYSFDAFGNTTSSGSTNSNTFAYTGREVDVGNLYYYRARYYNPQLQRFIAEDPLGFSGGDVNLYAYASNSPTNFIDPNGTSNPIVHLLETYYAGREAGLGIADSLNLGVQATLVDVGTQQTNASNTNIHAMAGQLPDGSYQTPEQAFNGAASVVDSNGAAPGDIDPFAIHTIEDSYSGSHNYQPDRDPLLGFEPSHFGPDSDYHYDAIDAVSQYDRSPFPVSPGE